MRRFVPLLIAGAAMLAAACRDAIAPTRSVDASALVVAGRTGLASAKRQRPPTGTVFTQTFSIPAAGGKLRVGDFWLDFPANSVCNPATSGYGKRFWDKPCATINVDFPITATYWWENGEAFIEFFPDIRFDPSKLVLISSKRPALIGVSGISGYQIWYWTRGLKGRTRIDEAVADKSVRTLFDPVTGEVFRRVKHFSGISLNSGQPCDDTVGDPDCVPSGGSFQ